MCFQITYPIKRMITLVAFVGLFSSVCFQMATESAWIRAGKVTLAAFVWLFSAVCYQMCPQIACMRRGKVGLVRQVPQPNCLSRLHLLDFSPLCVFKCLLKSPACVDAKSHWLHLFDFSPMCVFKCLLKSPAREDAKSHWLHWFSVRFQMCPPLFSPCQRVDTNTALQVTKRE